MNEKGVALVFVLWVLVILSVIVSQFCFSMRSEIKAARMIKNESQAYYIARAGIISNIQKLVQNEINKGETGDNQDSNWRVNVELPPQTFGEGHYKIKIGNESGKVNLNYAGAELLKMLFISLKVEKKEAEAIADAILDWRDPDALHRLNGAENDYYQSLAEPYRCRDGDFRYTDELLLVKGISKELYDSGLKNFISVSIIPKISIQNKKIFKRDHLNINAIPVEFLKILPGITSESVEKIINFRLVKDIPNLMELIVLIGPQIANELKKNIDYHYNRFYTFEAEGWARDKEVRQRIKVMVKETPMTEKKYKIVQWIDDVSDH